MKTQLKLAAVALLLSTLNSPLSTAFAATNINVENKFAYGANLGWIDWRGDKDSGAVLGEYVCSGYIYSANVGWINLGSGSPANQIQYQNNSARDFGVNHDGLGNLSGYAYGANIGWINFESNGGPKVDLFTGDLSGYVYSANCGWISLSNKFAYVQTNSIQKGALAGNGLPIAWLLQNFGTPEVSASADTDGDGVSNLSEYLADTNPNDPNDRLRIISFQRGNFGDPTRIDMVWTSKPTRFYALQSSPALGPFVDWVVLPSPGTDNAAFNDANPTDFFRIRAFRQLTP